MPETACCFCGGEAAVGRGRMPSPTPLKDAFGNDVPVCRSGTDSCWTRARKGVLAAEMIGDLDKWNLAQVLEHFFTHDGIQAALEVEADADKFLAILWDRLVNGESTNDRRADAASYQHLWKNLLISHADEGQLHRLITSGQPIFGYESRQFEREVRDARREAAAPQQSPVDVRPDDQQMALLYEQCQVLAESPKILDVLGGALQGRGLVGEVKAAKLLYLAGLSIALVEPDNQFALERGISVVVKGVSSAGKNNLLKHALAFVPRQVYWALTGMSERVLLYGNKPLAHRICVVYEQDGLGDNKFLIYVVRSLLSEGRVAYETLVKDKEGNQQAVTIEREGPTSFLSSTTDVVTEAQFETRVFSLPVDDTAEQTKSILVEQGKAAAGRIKRATVNFEAWHALYMWLRWSQHEVIIPFAEDLSNKLQAVAVRLRRDYPQILGLIRVHAILHQQNRSRDPEGRIIATEADYTAIRDLVDDIVSEGLDLRITASVRTTVKAAIALCESQRVDRYAPPPSTTTTAIAKHLGVDKSATHRHVQVAIAKGFLKNDETRGSGYAGKIRKGAVELPDETAQTLLPEILPPFSHTPENAVNSSTPGNNESDSSHLQPEADGSTPRQHPLTPDQQPRVDDELTGVGPRVDETRKRRN